MPTAPPLTPKYGISILIIRLLGAAKDVYSIRGCLKSQVCCKKALSVYAVNRVRSSTERAT